MTHEEIIKRLKEATSTIQPYKYVDDAIYEAIKIIENQESEKEQIIKALEEATVIGADCFGEGFECTPKWEAIEIVKRGGKE